MKIGVVNSETVPTDFTTRERERGKTVKRKTRDLEFADLAMGVLE